MRGKVFWILLFLVVLQGCVTTKKIRIVTEPSKANVMVNHVPVGTSPVEYEFIFSDKVSVYDLEVKKEGYKPQKLVISKDYFAKNPSEILKIKLKPLVCKFNLVSTPLEAKVYLDGHPVGKTPLSMDLVFGDVLKRNVTLEKEGYFSKDLIVSYVDCPGGFLNKNVSLEPQRLKVTFVTQPEGAEVYLDGNFIGLSPVTKDVIFGDKLRHTAVFIKNGFKKEIVDFDLKDVEKKKKLFIVLKKLEYKFLPRLEIKYQPEEEKILYSVEVEKAYEETIETSPNVSGVERVIFERLPIIIGKIDAHKDRIVYTRIYPKVSGTDEQGRLNTIALQIKELRDTIIYLQNMLQFPKKYEVFKSQIKGLVYLQKIDKHLFENLRSLILRINSPTDVRLFSNEIKNLIQQAGAVLERVKTLDVKNFSSEIWMTTISNPRKIRVTSSGKKWVDFSPSIYGNFVYFSSNRGSLRDFDIWRVNINRPSGLTKITNFPYSKEFSPSVDINTGSIVAFESLPLDALEKQIWTIRIDGTLPSQLKVGNEPDILGEKIVYGRREKGKQQIWIMDVDGSGETLLTEDIYNSFHPSFSPDGKWIVYVSDESDNKDIWIMKTDGSHKTQLTTNPSTDIYPVWNTDGYIYFVSNRGLMWGIWRLKPVIKE